MADDGGPVAKIQASADLRDDVFAAV